MKNGFSHMAVPKVSFNSKSQVRGVIIPSSKYALVFIKRELVTPRIGADAKGVPNLMEESMGVKGFTRDIDKTFGAV